MRLWLRKAIDKRMVVVSVKLWGDWLCVATYGCWDCVWVAHSYSAMHVLLFAFCIPNARRFSLLILAEDMFYDVKPVPDKLREFHII